MVAPRSAPMLPREVWYGGQSEGHATGWAHTRCSGAIEVQQRTAPERGLLLVPELSKCMFHYAVLWVIFIRYPPSIESIAYIVAASQVAAFECRKRDLLARCGETRNVAGSRVAYQATPR